MIRKELDVTRRSVLRTALSGTAASFLPLFSEARAAALGITQIAPGVFVHQGQYAEVNPDNGGDISNMSFIVGGQSVAVVDTGGSALVGTAARDAIAAVTALPVRYVINTHMHPDHIFGNAAFSVDKPEIIAHRKMARGLAARADGYLTRNKGWMGGGKFAGTSIVPPTKAVDDTLDIDLGGRVLRLKARETAHTDNDLTVLDLDTQTLILGDLAFAGRIPTIDGSIVGWLKLIDALKTEKVARVVPGHGPPSMSLNEALLPLERYLKSVASDVRAAIKDGRTLSETTETAALAEKDNWLLFDENHKRNVTAAFAELEWE